MKPIDFKDCKVICICEGRFEEDLINFLLEHNKLKFTTFDLVDEKVTRTRKAAKIQQEFLNRSYSHKIIILRIVDSKSEKFKLAPAYLRKIKEIDDVVTSPEIEILVVIDKSDFTKFQKQKLKPSQFCKVAYKLTNIKQAGFVFDYFKDIKKLINAIKKYKSIHRNDTCYHLADLLK